MHIISIINSSVAAIILAAAPLSVHAAPAPASSLPELRAIHGKIAGAKFKSSDSRWSQKRILELLPHILNGEDVNISLDGMKGNTCLHYACELGSRSLIQWLVENGADVNRVEWGGGNTPLHCSARLASLYSVNYLLAHGANPDIANNEGLRPVDMVGSDDHDAICAALRTAVNDGSRSLNSASLDDASPYTATQPQLGGAGVGIQSSSGVRWDASGNEAYDYSTEILDYTNLLPSELSRSVSSMNSKLRGILSPSDYVQILKGELRWYENLQWRREQKIINDYDREELQRWGLPSLNSKLADIAEHPESDIVFPREHFYDTVPTGIHYRGSLMYPKSKMQYQDTECVVERTEGLCAGYSARWLFWDTRTCRLLADFATPTVNHGAIVRMKGSNASFLIPYTVSEGTGNDWAECAIKAYHLDLNRRSIHSVGDDSRSSVTKLELKHLKALGMTLQPDEYNAYNVPKGVQHPCVSAAIERLGHSELGVNDDDETLDRCRHMDCPRCSAWAREGNPPAPITKGEGSNLVYTDMNRMGFEVVLNFDDLSLAPRKMQKSAQPADNGNRQLTPAEEALKARLIAMFSKCLPEEYADVEFTDLGMGYTYFYAGEICNDFFDGISGLVFPDGSIRVFQSGGNNAFSDFSRSYPAEQCLNVISSKSEPKIVSSGYPWLINHFITKAPNGRDTDIILWARGKSSDVNTCWLRIDEQTREISLLRQWNSAGSTRITPCWLPGRNWLMLPVDDHTYDIIQVREGVPDKKLAQLILECSRGYAIVLPNGRYAGTPGCEEFLAMGDGGNAYDMTILAPWCNRPDEVLEALGGNEDDIVALREANHRWLKKLGMRWDDMPAEPELSELPVAEVQVPPLYARESVVRIPVSLTAKSEAVTRLKVLVDGSEIELPAPVNVLPWEKASVTVEVPLASGQNWIEITPYNEQGQAGCTTKFRTILEGSQASDLYVVCLGVSEYDDASLCLKYAAKDAEDLAETFRKYGLGNKRILCLRDKEVRDAGVLERVDEFLSSATVNDRLVFYVAGHGLLDDELNYFYAPAGVDPARLKETGIPMAALRATMNKCKARKRILLLDTCHSGALGESDTDKLAALGMNLPEGVRAVPTARGMKVKSALPTLNAKQKKRYIEEMFSLTQEERGINVLAAAAGAEYALESEAWNNGVFTACLMNALKGDLSADANGDGIISGLEMQQHVVQSVSRMTNGAQKPTMSGIEDNADMPLSETVLNAVRKCSGSNPQDWARVTELLDYGCSAKDDFAAKGVSVIQMAMERHAPLSVIEALYKAGAEAKPALEWLFDVGRNSEEGESSGACRKKGYSPTDVMRVFLTRRVDSFVLERIFSRNTDLSLARYMFECAPNMSSANLLSMTPDLAVCRLLLEMGVDVDTRDEYGATALHHAQSCEKAKWLLQQGANPNARNKYGRNPMPTGLITSRELEIARLLLNNNCDPMSQDDDGNTALHLNCTGWNNNTQPQMVGLLVGKMSGVNIQNNDGRTPLHALFRGIVAQPSPAEMSILRILLRAGADITIRDNNGKMPQNPGDPCYELLQREAAMAERGGSLSYGQSGDRSDLQPLLNRMAALKCKHADSAEQQRHLLVLLPMIRDGASVDITTPDSYGHTALHYSCAIGSLSITRWLVNHGANVNAVANNGDTPLSVVGADNRAAITKLLKQHGAGSGGTSYTPAPAPAPSYGQSGDRSDLQPMIDRMAALRCKHESSKLYQKRLLMLLPMIRDGADVNLTTVETKGNTALHYAVAIGSLSITRWLLEHGANPNAVTDKGASVMKCVGSDNHKQIVNLLKQYGAY